MAKSLFPYSGGKSKAADWITSKFPLHEIYVEPFGGSAAVLLNKPRSSIEVYNDLDRRVVNFFEVFRDRTDELVEWLDRTPYSRELHDKYADAYFNNPEDLPEDDLTMAGVFFYLRYTQLYGKNGGKSGFQSTNNRNNATTFRNATEELQRLVERFQDVVIENRDYTRVIGHYDDENTMIYCDPPYVEKGTEWYAEGIDHETFWEFIADVDGYVAVSHMEIPDYVDTEEFTVVEKSFAQSQNTGHDAETRSDTRTERLICNYDPQEVRSHHIPHGSATEW